MMLNTMKNHERRILLNTCYGHLMSHVNMLVFPAIVLPLTARLNTGMGEVLALSFWMYLLFGVTALPWGLVADRLGAKPLLFVYYGGAGVASFAAALYLDSPSVFMVALAALGLFSGIYHPAGLGLISKEIQRVSYAMGINGMFGNLGLAIAPFLTGIVNWIWGPQAAYLILGVLNLSGILLLIGMPVSSSQGSGKTASTATNGFMGAFALLLLAMMLGGLIYRGATVILPAYFEIRIPELSQQAQRILGNGMTPNLLATMGASLIFLIGMLGQYTGGRCAEQFDPRRCYLAFLG
jgi:MFS family permease